MVTIEGFVTENPLKVEDVEDEYDDEHVGEFDELGILMHGIEVANDIFSPSLSLSLLFFCACFIWFSKAREREERRGERSSISAEKQFQFRLQLQQSK